MNILKLVLFFALMSQFIACQQRPGKFNAQQRVNETVQKHQDSQSYHEWDHAYSELFEVLPSLNSEEKLKFCNELGKLENKDLALFYEEIVSQSNVKEAPCLADLAPVLDAFYKEEEIKLNNVIEEDKKKSTKPAEQIKQPKVEVKELPPPGQGSSKIESHPMPLESSDYANSKTVERPLYYPEYVPGKDYSKEYLVYADLKKADRGCEIALTFDDGPSSSNTPVLMDILDSYDVKATFFMVGQNIGPNETLVNRMIRDQHKIGTHSWNHADLRKLSTDSAINSQIDKAQNLLAQVYSRYTGEELDYKFFRYPYGAMTSRLNTHLVKNRYFNFFWSIDSLDWKYKNDTVTLFRHMMSQLNSKKGGIALFHDIHKVNHIVIPKFLDELNKRECKTAVLTAVE